MSDFSKRLKELRTRRGLRQKDLAEALGVAQTTVANYEKKARFPDEEMLGRFADFFSVSMDFLLGRGAAGEAEPGASSRTEIPRPPSGAAARYLAVTRRGGVEAARELVDSLLGGPMGLKEVYLDVLEPALKEAGRLWEHGELAVGDEHMISEATQQVMGWIFPRSGPPPHGPLTCCVLAGPGEEHTIGPRMVADFLRLDRWNVRFLGGNLGIRHVLEALETRTPRILAVSVTFAANITGTADLIAAIREKEAFRAMSILVGGQAFRSAPDLWRTLGADGTGQDAGSAVDAANGLAARASQTREV